jgi:GTP pyrophosphokinase
MSNDPERRVEIDWQNTEGDLFVVKLGVVGEDRRGLYADLMSAISETNTNIRAAELNARDGGMIGTVVVEVENDSHLDKVIRAVRKVKGVGQVNRQDQPSGPGKKRDSGPTDKAPTEAH